MKWFVNIKMLFNIDFGQADDYNLALDLLQSCFMRRVLVLIYNAS